MLLMESKLGIGGFALSAGNLQPNILTDLYAHLDSNADKLRRIYYEKIAPQVSVCNLAQGEYIQCLKEVLCAKGIIDHPTVRAPLRPISSFRKKELIETMKYIGVI